MCVCNEWFGTRIYFSIYLFADVQRSAFRAVRRNLGDTKRLFGVFFLESLYSAAQLLRKSQFRTVCSFYLVVVFYLMFGDCRKWMQMTYEYGHGYEYIISCRSSQKLRFRKLSLADITRKSWMACRQTTPLLPFFCLFLSFFFFLSLFLPFFLSFSLTSQF